MLRAISADVAHAADPRHLARRPPAADPFELRDPEYIARTLPALRVMADVWFRADVRGLENIPPSGPVLLVGNHSGGTLIADTFIFAQAFYDRFGTDREFFQLAHDLVFKVPGIRGMITEAGSDLDLRGVGIRLDDRGIRLQLAGPHDERGGIRHPATFRTYPSHRAKQDPTPH